MMKVSHLAYLQLLMITILPVAIGMLVHKKFPGFSSKAKKPVKVFSIVLLLVIIAGIVAKSWGHMAGFFRQTGLASF